MSLIQIFLFFFLGGGANLGKNDKKYNFQAYKSSKISFLVWFHDTTTIPDVIYTLNSQKKHFLELDNFSTNYRPSKRIYKTYILRIF